MKKQFAVPTGITSNETVINVLTDLYCNRRDLFREDSEISCIYDSFSGIWNGGRDTLQFTQSEDFIREKINLFNNRGIPFRQIFSNLCIDGFLEDEQCNKIMKILSENKMNSVTIASDLALKIFKQRYPDLTYSSSVTKMLLDIPSFIEELKKDYDDVCLWIKFNNKESWNAIPESLRHKVSILVCQNCLPTCAYSYACHMQFSLKIVKSYGVDFPTPFIHRQCFSPKVKTAQELLMDKATLLHDDLDELVKMGYNRFKITGRCGPLDHIEMVRLLMYYLVDPNKYEEFMQIFDEKFSILRKQKVINIIERFDIETAKATLEPLNGEVIDAPAEHIVKGNDLEDSEDIIKNVLTGFKAYEIQQNIVYLENKAVSVIAITKLNTLYNREINFYKDLIVSKEKDGYTIPVQGGGTSIQPTGELKTNYGILSYLYLEPLRRKEKKEYKIALWNNSICFNIMLKEQSLTSRYVNFNRLQSIVNYLSQYISYTKIDVEWLNFAIVREVGQSE